MAEKKTPNNIYAPFANIIRAMRLTRNDVEESLMDMKLPKIDAATRRQLETTGLVIEGGFSNNDVEICNPEHYFFYKKRPILVYIKDQRPSLKRYYEGKLNPFHICYCKSLKEAEEQHRLKNRYVLTYNTSGKFRVSIHVNDYYEHIDIPETDRRLNVCQTCLHELNWKNFNQACGIPNTDDWYARSSGRRRAEFVRNFNIEEFLRTVKKKMFDDDVVYYAASNGVQDEYVLTSEQKYAIKRAHDFRCDSCGQVFSPDHLQIHHIDHAKGNNQYQNFAVLCEVCHDVLHDKEGGFKQQMGWR